MDAETLLARYDPPVPAIAEAVRRRLLALLPGVEEQADPTSNVIGYGYGEGYRNLICTLILSKKGVKLGLSGGASLPDPHGLLEGSGKVHRYVAIGSAEAAEDPRLAELIEAAATAWRTRHRL
jgi:hypothetical protein